MNIPKEFEQLLEIKEARLPLRDDGLALDWDAATNGRPEFGGVYVFWWTGSGPEDLWERMENKSIKLAGPPHHGDIHFRVKKECLQRAANGFVPIYVGKAFRQIHKRLGQHLNLSVCRTKVKTSSNQMRFNLDRLFSKTEDTRTLLRHIAVSYVKLHGEECFADRFYLEDLAIGSLRPLFNLDTER